MNEPFFTVKQLEKSKDYGKFAIEPLPQGFGQTMGNSLRRVLLTFIPGSAISFVKIKGVQHQFSTMKGLKEDIVEFILNLKGVYFNLEGDTKAKLNLEKTGIGDITASDIETSAQVTIANPDHYLGYISTKTAKLDATIWIEKGIGYIPSEERKATEIGMIPVDSFFSPIKRVNFTVEETRVGRATNFDKLTLELWTNGAVDTKGAIEEACRIIVTYFSHVYSPAKKQEDVKPKSTIAQDILDQTVEELDLAVRVTNALKKGGYETIGDFVGKSKGDLSHIRNLGDKSIVVIEKKLKAKGVELLS